MISVRKEAADSARLLRHEEEHVRQWRELGPFGFLRRYLGAYLRGGGRASATGPPTG